VRTPLAKEKRQVVDFSELLHPFEDQWVALSKEESPKVIVSDKNLKKLFKKLSGKDRSDFKLMKVPRFDVC